MPQYIPGGILFPTGEGHPGHPLPPGGRPVDPGYGLGTERPIPPIVLPPLPGIWPKPGEPSLPIVLPPEVALPPFPVPPIVIDPPPDKPNPVPPGEIWPELPPQYAGKLVAVIVIGEGKVHWYHVPPPSTNPPQPGPKR